MVAATSAKVLAVIRSEVVIVVCEATEGYRHSLGQSVAMTPTPSMETGEPAVGPVAAADAQRLAAPAYCCR